MLIRYANRLYGLELKSYVDAYEYGQARIQAARYGRELSLTEIWLVFFVETIDDENRAKYEVTYVDDESSVTVKPVFVATGV
ncbi:hypothetical protein KFU94_33260 [Chloroflexi bacterium TSY]|nr:hypothetical protein [Chloroflexi bacterium TSY]